MIQLVGPRVYLATLEKEHCRQIWEEFEFDFQAMTEPLNIGHSVVKSDAWFDEIQQMQGEKHIRLGIFLHDTRVIGDVALQDLDWRNRSCSLGLGLSKLEFRSLGYGTEAAALLLGFGFGHLGLERITANTLEPNIGAQRLLEKLGFVMEGRERQALYFAGRRWDRLNYAILRQEFAFPV